MTDITETIDPHGASGTYGIGKMMPLSTQTFPSRQYKTAIPAGKLSGNGVVSIIRTSLSCSDESASWAAK